MSWRCDICGEKDSGGSHQCEIDRLRAELKSARSELSCIASFIHENQNNIDHRDIESIKRRLMKLLDRMIDHPEEGA